MAAAKPVVSTPIHDVEALFGALVAIAATPDAFIAACRAALGESDATRAARESAMRACVARYSWEAAAETIVNAIDAVLAAPSGATPRRMSTPGGALRSPRLDDALA